MRLYPQFEEAGYGLPVAAYTLLDYRCDCVNKKKSNNTCVALAKTKYMGPASDRSDCATGSFTGINERLLAEINTSRREKRFEFSAAWWQGSTKYKVDIVGVGMATDHHRRTALLFAHRVIYATLTRRGTIERI